jgi:hypothetical protein
VVGITDAIDVKCGEVSTCALRQGGKVSCWGYGLAGECAARVRSSHEGQGADCISLNCLQLPATLNSCKVPPPGHQSAPINSAKPIPA